MNYKVGDTIKWRYYNTPDCAFYGNVHTGRILAIDVTNKCPYTVESPHVAGHYVEIQYKEIKGKI